MPWAIASVVLGALAAGAAAAWLRERRRRRFLARGVTAARAIVAAIGEAVVVVDASDTVLTVNPAAERLLDRSLAPGERLPVRDLVHLLEPRSRRPLPQPTAEALRLHAPVRRHGDTLLITAAGVERAVATRAGPLLDASGACQGAVLVLLDLTRQQCLAQDQAEDREREALGVLTQRIAHDFNNILGAIMGRCELLRPLLDSDRQRRQLESIDTSVEAGVRLAQRLGSLSQTASREQRIATDVHDLLADILDLVRPGAGTSFQQNLAAERSVVLAEPTRLQEALLHLFLHVREHASSDAVLGIATAVEPSARDAPCLEIRFSASSPATTPIGPPTAAAEIRTDREEAPWALAERIVHEHHGRIRLDNGRPDRCSCLVMLPLIDRPPTATPLRQDAGQGDAMAAVRTLLFADDEPVLRALAQESLGERGWTVFLAADGGEAVRIIERERQAIDLVILDLIMPEMDGITALQEIRRVVPGVRAIMCSGASSADHRDLVDGLGIEGVLVKPYRMGDLMCLIERVLATAPAAEPETGV